MQLWDEPIKPTRFVMNPTTMPAVVVEGRHTGLYAWVLRRRGIDPAVWLTATDDDIAFRTVNLTRASEESFALSAVDHSSCYGSRPKWLLCAAFLITASAALLNVKEWISPSALAVCLVVAGVCTAVFASQRTTRLEVQVDGRTISLWLKT